MGELESGIRYSAQEKRERERESERGASINNEKAPFDLHKIGMPVSTAFLRLKSY